MISVVGGCYEEICHVPIWQRVFGSAGRAAAAIGRRESVQLFTLIDRNVQSDFNRGVMFSNITHKSVLTDFSVWFQYLSPMSAPLMGRTGSAPAAGTLAPVIEHDILLFGMVDYVPVVHGKRVVYDPQAGEPVLFSASGSTADELVYVLNSFELERITDIEDQDSAAEHLLNNENAKAVIVKCGPIGAAIYQPGLEKILVPAYRARRVFKIGSGDIFAAAFSYFWMSEKRSFSEAADLASRSVAYYVESQEAELLTAEELTSDFNNSIMGTPGQVYLAAPFFSLEQRWLLEQTKTLLEQSGCKVFSPLHEVGMSRSAYEIASEDLKGLEESQSVLALLNDSDVGTVFEVGYAIKSKKPVVGFAERNSKTDMAMLEGANCFITTDYSTALYTAVWDSFR